MKIYFDSSNNSHEIGSEDVLKWRISAYAVIANDRNEVLVVTPRWRKTFDFPGGGMDPNESVFDGIARECLEETGYKVEVDKSALINFSETNFYHEDEQQFYHSINLHYGAKIVDTKQSTNIDSEIAKSEWVSLDMLNKDNCHGQHFIALEKIKKHLT